MSARNLLLQLVAVLAGGLAAEVFTRQIIKPDALFEIAFSPGAKTPHERFGFVYTPGFDGSMRHPDRVWAVPLRLDEHGFRPAARSPEGDGEPLRVALVAGRSMTMCYGLPDHETIQAFMVEHAERPLEVFNTGWAGMDPYRSWHWFLETLDRGEPFDVVLFCINPGDFGPYATIPPEFEEIPRHPDQEDFFRMLPGNIRMPKDALEDRLGPAYFRSYVVYGLLRYREVVRDARRDVERFFAGTEPAPAPVPDPAQEAEGRARYASFMEHMRSHFAGRDTAFGVVFLPSIKHATDAYVPFDAALPADIPRIDLQAAMRDDLDARDFIGLGHYAEEHTEAIALALNRFVRALGGPRW
jgi:hypothetical protein